MGFNVSMKPKPDCKYCKVKTSLLVTTQFYIQGMFLKASEVTEELNFLSK